MDCPTTFSELVKVGTSALVESERGNMFFNFTLVPLVSHILNETRYIAIPGKSYGYCANVLLSINYSAGTVTLMEVDVNTGFTLNAIYILGLK